MKAAIISELIDDAADKARHATPEERAIYQEAINALKALLK